MIIGSIKEIKNKFERELCFKYMDPKELGLNPITPEQLWAWIEGILMSMEIDKKKLIRKIKRIKKK